MNKNIYQFTVNKIDGTLIPLKDFQDKVLLIVNVASKCGLTPQYEGLEKLYEIYQEKGFEILAFPANEFLAQEPGSNEEIQQFCRMNYGVKFPLFEKIVVKGPQQHPLYHFLTHTQPVAILKPAGTLIERLNAKGLLTGEPHDIKWNFEKFLINKKGEIVKRFSPDVEPLNELITSAIEFELNA